MFHENPCTGSNVTRWATDMQMGIIFYSYSKTDRLQWIVSKNYQASIKEGSNLQSPTLHCSFIHLSTTMPLAEKLYLSSLRGREAKIDNYHSSSTTGRYAFYTKLLICGFSTYVNTKKEK